MTIMDDMKLLLRKKSTLTEEESAREKLIASRVCYGLVVFMALAIGLLYIHLFRTQPPGPTRDILVSLFNATTLSIVSGFVAIRIAVWARNLRPARSIPISIAAGILLFVGGNSLLDLSMRLKAELPRAEVRVAAMLIVGKLTVDDNRPADTDAYVVDASELVRSLGDRDRIADFLENSTSIREGLGGRQ